MNFLCYDIPANFLNENSTKELYDYIANKKIRYLYSITLADYEK